MLHIRGSARGTELTGTLFEPGEDPPAFRGAPDDDAPYVWVCDAFYEVESGGQTQRLGDREVQVAFESPMPRGFETREAAVEAATDHVRTQFVRVGVPGEEVTVEVAEVAEGASGTDA
ncbi:hypothetical protein HWV07_18110 [Natronomonas salina]|uniref:DUF7113 family protein n=1 Tax=Natronomonas salina TaxID=1710540 RepID=UPI0015B582A4|nr:hypothetical protein [Natronomonas salina]QLD90852.1 hypothetical protein HWV07_18110 [Natronomonas salina]